MNGPVFQSDTCQYPVCGLVGQSTFFPADHQGHGDIVQCRKFRQQMVELVNETQRAVAQFTALRFV